MQLGRISVCLGRWRDGTILFGQTPRATSRRRCLDCKHIFLTRPHEAKGGIAALTHALAVTLRDKARVNSISPGWIDTEFKDYDGPDAAQQPAGRVGNPMDIANMVLFLCSEKAGFITGENICIDGGMTRQMIYHGDHGWTLKE